MQHLEMKLNGIRELLLKELSHPYLQTHVESPVIDEDKLMLLLALLHNQKLEDGQIEKYSIPTMLLQIALDTHEHVRNTYVEEDEEGHKVRQLTVLAGVYYSGLYYKILADSNEIELIKNLASGVKEVNEHKITIYQKDSISIDKLMNSVKMIESSLVGKVAEHFQMHDWNDFAANWLFVNRILREEKQFLSSGRSFVFDALKKLVYPNEESSSPDLSAEQQHFLLSICSRYIDYSMSEIETEMKSNPEIQSLLSERLKAIAGLHHSMSKKLVEEG